MGQTASNPGTKYQSLGHELTAIRESLQYLRERVKKTGESESPLLVIQINKYEARVKELEYSSVVCEITKREVEENEPAVSKGLCTGVLNMLTLKRRQEEEETPVAKRVCFEVPKIAQKSTYAHIEDYQVRDLEAAFAEMEAESPAKKVKVIKDEMTNESQVVAKAADDLEKDLETAFAESKRENWHAENSNIKSNEVDFHNLSQTPATIPAPITKKRSRDDIEAEIERVIESDLTTSEKDEHHAIKKTKISEDEREKSIEKHVLFKAPELASAKPGEDEKKKNCSSQYQAPVYSPSATPKRVLKTSTSSVVAKAPIFVPRQCRNVFRVSKKTLPTH